MELKVLGQDTPAPLSAGGGCSSSGCGSSGDQLSHLPEAICEKVHNHPCYSEEAHHHYARMHVAVAPACNIQCHYCNRKYDCANESRPGVVSELLTPDQAVKKVMAVAANIPQMTVLGIAGPGDPLANPERTLLTFRELTEKAPDIKLCVSTNGLALPGLVKVNSVMIPGVNDVHLKEVSKVVKEKGAFLHNVMPLIAEAEHGTFYGVMGQRGPIHDELQALQDECAGDMNMMRHCRQCRADAVGLLGEDRGDEFSMDKIEMMAIDYEKAMEERKQVHAAIEANREAHKKSSGETFISLAQIKGAGSKRETRPVLMAVATEGHGLINQHFGHAREFLIYEASATDVRFIGHRKVDLYCSGSDSCGDAETALQKTIRTLEGCEAVLCSKIGFEPWGMLEDAGIMPNGEHPMEPIEEAVAAVYREMADDGRLDQPEPVKLRMTA